MSGRVVLITGAAGGIGQALCRQFIAAGDTVIGFDRDAAALAKVPGIVPAVADLTDAAATSKAVADVVAKTGPVDVLIANAAIAEVLSLAVASPADWARETEINLYGTVNSVEAVRAGLLASGNGAIVVIGSVNGLTTLGHPIYSAAKAALLSYTKSLAVEFGPQGLRANMICPGTVRTPAWEGRMQKNPEVFERLKKWYPLRRVSDPDDIAGVALFLASDAARMITGAMIPVDGGLMAGNAVMTAELTLENE
ncbi:SDR family oxidoreductase [Lacibacterium aquatile]|uniref:SDR family oxidoreductase n=1 Tax=Lacibacterium aquatile TaxID=1168082 RepID=A0ABW5DLL7_9PROT